MQVSYGPVVEVVPIVVVVVGFLVVVTEFLVVVGFPEEVVAGFSLVVEES